MACGDHTWLAPSHEGFVVEGSEIATVEGPGRPRHLALLVTHLVAIVLMIIIIRRTTAPRRMLSLDEIFLNRIFGSEVNFFIWSQVLQLFLFLFSIHRACGSRGDGVRLLKCKRSIFLHAVGLMRLDATPYACNGRGGCGEFTYLETTEHRIFGGARRSCWT